ncbi:uncharacterized protein BDR25DRAFT_300116 [Lindgomyces ingoldianus]|uniref:Uncharacterized protein n=1 Tax=Lindgomyces ingoldianus TaxID=673940 RepID=A0ACB6REV5_9PLEO|nr:uncharacterized protein BDR25DRAFT_300116 [Lindgomyces ingoldianus]KAF2477021.1 hypothetical protein BDR25DRAFT_300116 [Lindgomyces ingoldianus]
MTTRRVARGGRNPKDLPRDQQVSRKVSWLLRHGANQEGLKLGKGGYVSVQDALNTRALKSLNITFPELRAMVAENDKQRFSMILASSLSDSSNITSSPVNRLESEAFDPTPKSDDPSDYIIRANQGHSISVETEGLLTEVSEESGNVPELCVHGTDEPAWRLILKSGGLRCMGRNHIHFASGLPRGFKSMDQGIAATVEGKDAPHVISGMRKSSTILIYINIRAAMAHGIKFFLSENGVVLTEGNEKGVLSYEFFEMVESRKKGGGVLMRDGVLPDDVEVDIRGWEKDISDARSLKRSRKGKERSGRGGKARVNDDSRDVFVGV